MENVLLLSVVVSKSARTAHASTCLPPACLMGSSGRNSPSTGRPISSSNSLLAAASGSSASENSPFGIDHAPLSFLDQNGPPGWTSNTSKPSGPGRFTRKRRSPALCFGKQFGSGDRKLPALLFRRKALDGPGNVGESTDGGNGTIDQARTSHEGLLFDRRLSKHAPLERAHKHMKPQSNPRRQAGPNSHAHRVAIWRLRVFRLQVAIADFPFESRLWAERLMKPLFQRHCRLG